MCLYPKLIKNRKYIANKKNGGVIPAVFDKRVLMVPVGCGKCIECKKQKSNSWRVRLQEEIKINKNTKFVTLTFETKYLKELKNNIKGLNGYELDNEICTLGVRRFLERWRKKYKKSVKHWLVTELGQTNYEHVHIHGIIWTNESNETIEKLWKYGKIWVGDYVNEKTINYIVKYINKTDFKHKEYNSKVLCSAGIGKNYIDRYDAKTNKYVKNNTKEYYKLNNGIKVSLPIYYRNKIYNEYEREKLWIEKIDKNKRYVMGVEVDANNEKEYYRLLEIARNNNKRLGYGDNSINWERKKYENERRNLIYKERLKKNYK